MISKQQYVEYLICTIGNYTSSNLAEHLDDVSHDVITDYLSNERHTARGLWELVVGLIEDSPEAFLLVDDSVQDKRYSQFIELVKLQYSGAEHGLVRGIGVVNLVHSAGAGKDFYPMDYRIYAPDQDGKSKNDHFAEMVKNAVYAKRIRAKRILFDTWYASAENLKLVHRLDLVFFTTLKSNRMVSLSKEGGWIHLDEIEWTAERLENGVMVKLKEVPFKVRLFKVVVTDGDIDWVITNCPDETLTTQAAQDASDVRWQVEELHRGLKQLTGTEKCQCRKARSQRNHIACCYHAWLSLKVKAKALGKTLYQTKDDLLSDYLRAELAAPRIQALMPA
ncbi:MAG: transposase [Chloroflexota bacterium]